jgi:hypothetical protein
VVEWRDIHLYSYSIALENYFYFDSMVISESAGTIIGLKHAGPAGIGTELTLITKKNDEGFYYSKSAPLVSQLLTNLT